MSAKSIAQLRADVRNMRVSEEGALNSLKAYAKATGRPIKRCRYADLQPWSDTLARHKHTNSDVITGNNLQYFPSKVYYVELSNTQ